MQVLSPRKGGLNAQDTHFKELVTEADQLLQNIKDSKPAEPAAVLQQQQETKAAKENAEAAAERIAEADKHRKQAKLPATLGVQVSHLSDFRLVVLPPTIEVILHQHHSSSIGRHQIDHSLTTSKACAAGFCKSMCQSGFCCCHTHSFLLRCWHAHSMSL